MSKIQLADLGPVIECMEDMSFGSSVLRSKNYVDIVCGLQNASTLDVKMAESLINICLKEFNEDLQFTPSILMIIKLILKRIKEGKCEGYEKLSLEKTALAIVVLTKKLLKKSLLRKMSLETLLLHPDDVLRQMVTDHMQEVVDLIDYYPKTEFQGEVTEHMINIVARIFQILPPANKSEFVKCGLKAWFNSVIPGVLYAAAAADVEPDVLKQNVEVLELLVEHLVTINYEDSSDWLPLLSDISYPHKYSEIIKNMIITKPNYWHRLWMILIKLLKEEITKINISGTSPINALLPVVETAFKSLHAEIRCRAFECWNVLIDNFSKEQNEALLTKRLKLLMIPLKLNNAKVPETVLAKFNTWWYLIRRFKCKIDKHADTVLIPFLSFCFGKVSPQSPILGLLTDDLSNKCVEALVEIVGHVDCEGCITLPRLNGRLISTKLLVEYWPEWINALAVAIRSSSHLSSETGMQRVRCLWKGFTLTVAELPPNQIRRDLFVELLKFVDSMKRERANGHIIFNILIGSLFENDDRIKQLLKTKEDGPIHVIIRILDSTDMNHYYKVLKTEEAIAKLKPIMTLFMDPSYTNPDEIVRIFMKGYYDTKLLLWAALAEAICESKHELMLDTLHEFVLWPFNIQTTPESLQISESQPVWYKWFTLYSYLRTKMSAKFDETIMSLMRPGGNFSLLAPIAMLKQQLSLAPDERISNLYYQADSLVKALEKVEDFKSLEQYLPILIDTLVLLLENAIKPNNFNLMQKAVSSVAILLKLVNGVLRQEESTCTQTASPLPAERQSGQISRLGWYEASVPHPCSNLSSPPAAIDLTLLEHLMKPIGAVLQSEKCLAKVLITPLIDELCSCALNTSKHHTLQKELVNMLTITLSIYHRGTYMSDKVTNTLKTIQNDESKTPETSRNEPHVNSTTGTSQVNDKQEQTIATEKSQEKNTSDIIKQHQNTEALQTTDQEQNQNKNDFTVPGRNTVKKCKKKEPNIVSTVLENGEEFVVVKSHWKFNPKNLTENQKEKLKRKREDIPALYQDLSQSQDEFKLTTWKTDSQDASTTTSSKSESNSQTNEDVTNILKNIPSTDVVPKIIENIFPDITSKNLNEEVKQPTDKNAQLQKTPTGKNSKTPRLALKDRVFRNVRNLMEKSGTQSASKFVIEDIYETLNENSLKTPVTKEKSVASSTNSAPSQVSDERPLRVVKKPKKLEDTEIYALKKRGRSLGSFPLDSTPENEACEEIENAVKGDSDICVQSALYDGGNIIESHENAEPPQIDSHLAKSSTETIARVSESNNHLSQINNLQIHVNTNQEKHVSIDQNKESQDKTDVEDTPVEQLPNNPNSQLIEEIHTPKPADKRKDNQQSTIKKKRSRIAKQLLIDMVEGHPILQQSQSEKRPTRKNPTLEPKDSVSKRRKSWIEKSNKIKAELESAGMILHNKTKTSPKTVKAKNNPEQLSQEQFQSQPITVIDSQNNLPESSSISEDQPMSEDVIESSQDSSVTTISIKPASSKKKIPFVRLDKENPLANTKHINTQKMLEEIDNPIIASSDSNESKDDIELPKNKTAVTEEKDMTEDMDTEPMGSGDVILVDDEILTPIVINTEDTVVGKETQEMAEADTLPMEVESSIPLTDDQQTNNTANHIAIVKSNIDNDTTYVSTQNEITPAISGTAEVITDIIQESSNTGSPSRDDVQRKKEFLNDTIEISPIKTLSPIQEDKSPSLETSSDYVVIKLATPVQSNGEPITEKCDSPEVFTEDKVSPDKRDQSPPRKEITNNNNSSPSSSLSLKKNRPQMRFNGRAAQMLELCVPNSSRPENEEPVKRSSPVSTPARRNLRKVYNTDNTENQEINDKEDNENFLTFTRALPTLVCSPSGPILKRKLAEITDESTVSPACKRKRVSFHDPPVSTTVAVQKYIEPCGLRSPSNSAVKRLEKQSRVLTNTKSPKRLENVFRLETVLTKAVESFSDETTVSNDTEMSLDETPAVEIIKTSELNDKDPICSVLLDCKDPIENIAGELSSPSTKALLIKELEGKVETIADLAKMTELEVNRLCIKAPKVTVAKKVLTDYAVKRAKTQEISNAETPTEALVRPPHVDRVSMEVQTDQISTTSSEMQTVDVATSLVHTQTDGVATSHCSAQTNESGYKSSKDVVASCLSERPDFVNQLTMQLDESSVTKISEKLPTVAVLNLLMSRMTAENAHNILNSVLTQSKEFQGRSRGLVLKLLQDYLCDRFDMKDLILFCSQLLQKVHDKPI